MHLINSYVSDSKVMQINLIEMSFSRFYDLFEYLDASKIFD